MPEKSKSTCPKEGCKGELHVKCARMEPASYVCDACLEEVDEPACRPGGKRVDARALFLIGTGMQAALEEMRWWLCEPFPSDAQAMAAKTAVLLEAWSESMRQALGADETEWDAQAARQVAFNPLVADGIRASDVAAARRERNESDGGGGHGGH